MRYFKPILIKEKDAYSLLEEVEFEKNERVKNGSEPVINKGRVNRIIEHAAGMVQPILLKDYFRLDNWTIKEGLLLLIGIVPDKKADLIWEEPLGSSIEKIESSDITRLDELSFSVLNKNIRQLESCLENSNCKPDIKLGELREFLIDIRYVWLVEILHFSQYIRKVFFSGDHADRNAPDYYIKWAISKGYEISWLEYAKNHYPEMLPESIINPNDTWEFDSDSPYYPEELDIALQAWRAVANKEDVPKHPKPILEKWLDENYSNLSDSAKKRICVICNWEKSGGRPSS